MTPRGPRGLIAVVGLVGLLVSGCSNEMAPVAELTGPTMGTVYHVQIAPPPEEAALSMLQLRIDERLREIDAWFSTYRDDSDLSGFNRSDTTDWQPVPAELVELVRRAEGVSELTDGRYDVTVGPLVDAWGFGSAGSRTRPPDATTLAALLPRVGYQRLDWRASPPALRKGHPELHVDLSSIAKGWAVDQIDRLLHGQGLANYLVEIGGEALARGERHDQRPWRIGITRPDRPAEALGGFPLRDLAVATSGDYENFFEYAGERFSHTIDPVSGQAVAHRLASVTVVADNGTDADAWATALLALGERDGPATAERLGIAALFLIRDGEVLREHFSPAFASRVAWQPSE
jgi:thiamine biosynthesis lipoprotein